jgi:DNA-binding transcriptional MerR regulator
MPMAQKAPDGGQRYRTAAFAALAGVTSRALRHYDRLGLLKPKRSAAGYRIYAASDLETLEEIVALKFIGIPLKDIPAIRRRSRGSFANALRAQRQTLEARQRMLSRAVAAVAAAEAALASGTPIDVSLFRQIMEVMQMGTNHEATITEYVAVLKSRTAHVLGMSPEGRVALRDQWLDLIRDVRAAIHEDPGSPRAQSLLDRWLSFLQDLTGTGSKSIPFVSQNAQRATPELRDEVWGRRAEWMPPGTALKASMPADADAALALARKLSESFANPDVLDFIKRARAARQR